MDSQTGLRALAIWYDPRRVEGRLGLQFTLNATLLSALMLLHATPWVALAASLVLFALTCRLYGFGKTRLLAVYGLFGYVGELWIVGLGGVWTFRVATVTGLDGGLFGVPFYMLPTWSMVGALMLALVALDDARTR